MHRLPVRHSDRTDVAVTRQRVGGALAVLALTTALTSNSAGAQEQTRPAAPAFRSSVNLVLQPVVVLDRDGVPVTDLTVSDFTVEENGVRQELSTFLAPNAAPLDVALVLDSSASLFHFAAVVRRAATTFLTLLEPLDCVYLLPFNDYVGPGTWGRAYDPRISRRINGLFMDGGTALYDALLESIETIDEYSGGTNGASTAAAGSERDSEASRAADGDSVGESATVERSGCGPDLVADSTVGPQRRRAIVLLTDGSDEHSQVRFDEVLQRANHSSIPIFPVVTGAAGRDPRLREIMNRFAGQTGGSILEASSPDDLRSAYRDVVAMLKASYLLGYLPPDGEPDTWREVRVRSRRPSHRLVYRDRYFR